MLYALILYYADHEEIIEDVTHVHFNQEGIIVTVRNEIRVIKPRQIKRVEVELYKHPKIK